MLRFFRQTAKKMSEKQTNEEGKLHFSRICSLYLSVYVRQ